MQSGSSKPGASFRVQALGRKFRQFARSGVHVFRVPYEGVGGISLAFSLEPNQVVRPGKHGVQKPPLSA